MHLHLHKCLFHRHTLDLLQQTCSAVTTEHHHSLRSHPETGQKSPPPPTTTDKPAECTMVEPTYGTQEH